MARTIDEIYNGMISDISANETLNTNIYTTSKTGLFRLFAYVVASAIWALEKIFDTHKSELEDILANMKPHDLLWYRNAALAFQYGYELNDNGEYDVIDEDAMIVAFAAASESNGYVQLKAAKDENGTRAALSEDEKAAFDLYIERIKDAGVRIRKISQEADHLRLIIEVYYDPLVLDDLGQRLDGTNNSPLQDAITNYLENLPFNGEYSNTALTDDMQPVDGIQIPQILSAETYWGTYDWSIINTRYIPEAGWMKVYTAAELNEEVTIVDNGNYKTVTDGHLTIKWRVKDESNL